MAHIESQRNRQYIESQLTGHEVSQGIKQVGNAFSNTLQTGLTVVQKANESDLASKQIDLATEWYKKNNEINLKYQNDPTNPQRETELQEAYTLLSDRYKVNPLVENQWSEAKRSIYDKTKMYNARWQESQLQTNAQLNLKNGYEQLVNQVSMLGMNGAGIEDIKLTYANGVDALRKGASAVLGDVVAENFLKDSTHDMMTTYISALAINDPLKAQALLKDEGVRNDIGKSDTLEKLDNYVSTALLNYNKKVAVSELGDSLRAMNSEQANRILSGQADLNEVMKFGESHKNLPQGSINAINSIYGIGEKNEIVYNTKTKKYETRKSGSGSGSSSSGDLISLKKLSKMQKEELANGLEQSLTEMFFFDEPERVNAKKVNKKGQGGAIQSDVLQKMNMVAQAQGAIDTAWNAGIITKAQRQNMMNKYIEPLTNYLDANMQDLDEKKGVWGAKLGYGELKKQFSTDGIPANHTNKIRERNSMLLTAQGRYYTALDTTAKQLGLNNIYELENLKKEDQERIYKTASNEAINYAKKYGSHPEIFFKQEYPQLYAVGVEAFGIKDGNKIAKQVAQKIYGAEDLSKVDVNKVMSDEVLNTRAYKNQRAKELVNSIIAVNKTNPEGRVLMDMEIEERAKALGLTMKQLTNDAYSKRVSPQMYLIYLENLKKENRR